MAQRCRNALVGREDLLFRITGVAAEQLVSSVTGQQLAVAVVAGESGEAEGRQRRGVAERLIVVGGDLRDVRDEILSGDVVLAEVGVEGARGDSRIGDLVVTVRIEAHRIAAGSAFGELVQHPDHGRAVGASGQKRGHSRSLGFAGDRFADRRAESALELFEVFDRARLKRDSPP